jgi:hypothetical protein
MYLLFLLIRFEWRIISQWEIQCHLRISASSVQKKLDVATQQGQQPNRQPVEIHIQLFKAEEKQDKYVIDLRKIAGETFQFMSLSGAILGNLNL